MGGRRKRAETVRGGYSCHSTCMLPRYGVCAQQLANAVELVGVLACGPPSCRLSSETHRNRTCLLLGSGIVRPQGYHPQWPASANSSTLRRKATGLRLAPECVTCSIFIAMEATSVMSCAY